MVRHPVKIPNVGRHGCVRPCSLAGVFVYDFPASRSIVGYEQGSVWVWRVPVIWYEAGLSLGMRRISVGLYEARLSLGMAKASCW